MKELELGFALSFADKIEGIFEKDEVMLERVKNACKSIMVEIEGQYQWLNHVERGHKLYLDALKWKY